MGRVLFPHARHALRMHHSAGCPCSLIADASGRRLGRTLGWMSVFAVGVPLSRCATFCCIVVQDLFFIDNYILQSCFTIGLPIKYLRNAAGFASTAPCFV